MRHILIIWVWMGVSFSFAGAQTLEPDSLKKGMKEGRKLFARGEYSAYVSWMDSLLQLAERELPPQDTLKGEIMLARGLGFYLDGSPAEALEEYERAYELLAGHSRPQNELDCLYRMGIACRETGDLFRGEDYMLEAGKVARQNFGEQHFQYGKCFNALGNLYIRMERQEAGLDAFEKVLPIFSKRFGDKSAQVAAVWGNRGVALTDLGRFEEGADALQIALDIREEILPPGHPVMGMSYNNLGDLYLKAGRLDLAATAFNQSLDIWKASLGERHYFLAINYRNLAELNAAHGKHKQALEACQEGAKILCPGFEPEALGDNPPLEPCISQEELLNLLEVKAHSCREMGRETLALQCLERAVELVDRMRQGLRRENSRLNLAQRSRSIFEEALDICFALYQQNGSRMWFDKAFQMLEKSRSSLLLAAFRGEEAGRYAGIDSEILREEKGLRKEAVELSQQLDDAIQGEGDAVRIEEIQQQYFGTVHRYETLLDSLSRRFPRYFELKYRNEVISAKAVADSLQDSQTAFLSFYQGEKNHYVIGVGPSSIVFKKLGNHEKLLSDASFFAAQLSLRTADWQIPAFGLYQGLLQEALDDLGKTTELSSLIILRDGNLEYLPFEALLSASVDKGSKRDYPFLIKDYSISYAMSATLFFADKPVSKSQRKGYFAMAPNFEGISESEGGRSLKGSLLPELPFAKDEVEQGKALFGGQAWLGAQASEEKFKSSASGREILHLATHTLVDDRDPLWSRLVFGSSAEGQEDGFLHTYELLGLDLDANLAVLSACNTGTGGLQRGEGMMSLARGFAYAGCPAIVMTHWTVSDRTTSKVIQNFFGEIKKGLVPGEALRNAKLTYLESAEEVTLHPYFWAGISLIGKAEAPQKNNEGGSGWLLILLGIAGFLWLLKEGEA